MSTPRPPRLEFTDCTTCGKRVATTAPLCRHCNSVREPFEHWQSNSTASSIRVSRASTKDPRLDHFDDEDSIDIDAADSDSHFALGYGGYDSHDVYDESDDDSVRDAKRQRLQNFWWYVAAAMLLLLLATTFVPAFM